MSQKFLKVFKKADIKDVQAHLLIFGDLSAHCAQCQAIDIKFNARVCPQCQTDFKYIAFRNVMHHIPKMYKISEERPDVVFVDFEDYKKNLGAIKAEEFLK